MRAIRSYIASAVSLDSSMAQAYTRARPGSTAASLDLSPAWSGEYPAKPGEGGPPRLVGGVPGGAGGGGPPRLVGGVPGGAGGGGLSPAWSGEYPAEPG